MTRGDGGSILVYLCQGSAGLLKPARKRRTGRREKEKMEEEEEKE